MLTEDEKSNWEERSVDPVDIGNNYISPKWEEIEDLLDFAEKLKIRCDTLADRVLMLQLLQTSFSIILLIAFWIKLYPSKLLFGYESEFGRDYKLYLFEITFYFCSVAFIMFFSISQVWISKFIRKIKIDSRSVDSIVDTLRENQPLISKDLSSLQKIKYQIEISRFEIRVSIPPRNIIALLRNFIFDFYLER